MKIMYVNGKEIWKPKARYFLKDNDDLEILDKYNAEIRGFYNYYSIANNSSIINRFKYIMEYSIYKTYATKCRSMKKKMIAKYRVGKDFGIHYSVKNGDKKVRLFYNKEFKRKKIAKVISVDSISQYIFHTNSTSLMDRLKSNQCEICGAENVSIEIHHVHKLKDLKGKKYWEKLMIARNRKTIALCHDCHVKLHHGLLD